VDYLEEATAIWREFVPPSGQAETMQGELLRAVEKLRDEAIRNGNGNWDRGFEILLAYLERQLPDPAVFEPETIGAVRAILLRLHDQEYPLLEDAPYDYLADRVVDWYRGRGSVPHQFNPDLYR
jgi:hypothetical protein